MHDVSDQRIAVVGAAGFVGRALLRQFEELGIAVTAVIRGLPELSVDGTFHAAAIPQAAVEGAPFDVVVNLAYPTDTGPTYKQPHQNAEIAHTVKGLLRHGGRLVQVSTLAVFGLALDRPVRIGPVSNIRDNAYVEAKIEAERTFAKEQEERGLSLDIVRLGNVWGHASGTWAVPLVQRLATGRPVGIADAVGHSNTTDVANVASYLAFLALLDDPGPNVRHHHLAEFSGITWNEWIEPIAGVLGVEPVYADASTVSMPVSDLDELAEVFAPLKPRNVYRRLSDQRTIGSWTRTVVRQLPTRVRSRLKSDGLVFAADPDYERAEQTFLSIMAGRQEFESVVDPNWTQVLTKEQSLEGVLRWLDRG
jgi:nucleoside-diphosphate-sugar epimerase